jgi:ubiquitin-conjugating enzyme E2 Z
MTLDRIRRDLQRVLVDPLPGVFILPNEEDISTIHVLISGPFETPYEGGFFHFVVRCPPNYPFK